MKWINLAERKPEDRPVTYTPNNDIHFKTYLGNRISYSTWWLTGDNITFNQPAPRPSSVLSQESVYWLDESAETVHSSDDVEEGYMLISVPIGSLVTPPGQITNYQETQYREYKRGNQSFRQYLENVYPDETRRLLAEQHRNTRHDAVDKMYDRYKLWKVGKYGVDEVDNLIDGIQRDIMQLQQRKP